MSSNLLFIYLMTNHLCKNDCEFEIAKFEDNRGEIEIKNFSSVIWIYIAKTTFSEFPSLFHHIRHHFCTHFNYHNTSHLSITSNHFASLEIILTHFAIIYAITLPSYPHQKSVRIEVTLPSLLNHLHHFAITFASTLRALLGQTKICVQGRIRQGDRSI